MPEPDWSIAPDAAVGHGLAWVAAENLDAAFLRSYEAEERRDRGRLAGPVRSEERKDLTLGHLQIQPVEGSSGPVAVGDVLEGKGDWSWPRRESASGGAATREDKVFSDGSGRARAVDSRSYNRQGCAGIRHMKIDEEVTTPVSGVLAHPSRPRTSAGAPLDRSCHQGKTVVIELVL